jgi:hypothetical protein
MDRQIVFPGSIPLDTDLLNVQRNTMAALGYLAQATLGAGPVVDGLACTPTAPASMTVTVGQGSLAVLATLDAVGFGSLPADNSSPLVKMGINLAPVPFTLTAPTTSGQSANFLIQASLSEADASPLVLPYYNSANPAQPYAGPDNSGVAQNTQRLQRVQLQLKPGASAPAGTQATPPVDNGWVGLFVVTVNYGQTAISAGSIFQHVSAPILPFKLPMLAPGFSRQAVFSSPGTASWTAPAGVTRVKVRLVGGGGGGTGTNGNMFSGGGGGAGGYSEGVFPVTPGQVIAVTVGSSGAGQAYGASGTVGGNSAFGSLCSATGGQGGVFISSTSSPGGAGGAGASGSINLLGGYGGDGIYSSMITPGNGGASAFGGGGRGAVGGNTATLGQAPGSGGGGAYGLPGSGGSGAAGLVIVEY